MANWMGRGRFEQLAAVFEHARDLEPDARGVYLAQACGDEPELRAQVSALLDRHDRGGLLDHAIRPADAPQESIPERIGRFRILEHVGHGGMGVVYRAEQDQPRRQVALKMMHAGLVTDELRRRFEFETSVLARLQHPGIAQIYEVGTWDAGSGPRPFFAMELVEGVSLDTFLAQTQPSIEARLRLFIDICDAVQHAHQKGVIHRDLKPANILVTAEGAPKILDFGVARATDADVQATLYTAPGQLVGTLAYMSPEQVGAATDRLDTRSDVYALGVILYEMLTGRLPYDVIDKPLTQVVRVISEAPPLPMTVVARAQRGDLTTITGKALEKEPARRYASVSDLAADIRRHLNDEPIAARPATNVYQLRKFARRNKGLVAGVGAAFVTLVLGVIVSVSLAVQRSRALDEANRQRDIAQAVNEFLERDLLANANPSNEPDRSLSLREVVDRASERISERFPDQPMVEAAIRTTLSNTYKGLGEYAEASRHAKAALELLQKTTATPTRELLLTMNRVGSLEKAQGRMKQAEEVFRNALRIAEEEFGPDHETTMSITNNLALLLERRQAYEEAAKLLEPLLERRMRLLGDEHRHTMITMNNLALLYLSMERFDDSERLHLKELELSSRVMGPEHPDTLISIGNLATVYASRDEYAKAEPLMRDVVETQSRILGSDHPSTLYSKVTLAHVLTELSRFDEAEAMLRHARTATERKLGAEHPQTLRLLDRLAMLYLAVDRLDEAESIARENYQTRKRMTGETYARTGVTLGLVARICRERGKLQDAETLGLRSYEILESAYGAGHSQTRKSAADMVELYDRMNRPNEKDIWRARTSK